MELFIKPSFIEFLNQEPNDDFQKLWDSSDNDFWSLIAETYIQDEFIDGDIKEFVHQYIKNNFKVLPISLNHKSIACIYQTDETDPQDTVRYVCQQLLMTVEEYQKRNGRCRMVIADMQDFRADDKSYISLKLGDDNLAKPKTMKLKPERLAMIKCTEQQFRKTFGQIKVPPESNWSRLNQIMTVAKNPKKDYELGSIVTAIARRPKKKDFKFYGYIISRQLNNNKRPISLTIRRFNPKLNDEVWIWNGPIKTGSWLHEKELLDLRSQGKNASSTFYRDLLPYSRPFTPKF